MPVKEWETGILSMDTVFFLSFWLQEHIESHTPLYSTASLMTKMILNVPKEQLEDVCAKYVGQALDETFKSASYRIIRLRDYFMPVFARIYYELIFGEPCSGRTSELVL